MTFPVDPTLERLIQISGSLLIIAVIGVVIAVVIRSSRRAKYPNKRSGAAWIVLGLCMLTTPLFITVFRIFFDFFSVSLLILEIINIIDLFIDVLKTDLKLITNNKIK